MQRTSADRWWIVGGMGLAVFMASLDMSVVNLALPEIRDSFGAATQTTQWVVLGYLLPLVALALPSGRWLDRVNHRPVLVYACAGFAASSVMAGLAPGIGWLIAARVLQGFCGSALMTLIPVLISTSVGTERRGRAMGVVDTLGMLGLISGPAIGGLLVDSIGWPWIFYLNVPVCVALIGLAYAQLPRGERVSLPDQNAAVEAAVLTAAAGLVMIALTLAAGQAPQLLGLGLAAIPLIIFWRRLPISAPVLDLLRRPAMIGPLAALAATATATGVVFYIIPFHLIIVLEVSASVAGATMLAFPLAAGVLGLAAGYLGDRMGHRRIAFAGMVTLMCGLLVLMPASPSWSPADVAWRLVIAGAGIGLFNAPNMSAAMSASPGNLLATAGAATSLARQGGFACGPAIATLVWALSGFHPAGINAVFIVASTIVALGALPLVRDLWPEQFRAFWPAELFSFWSAGNRGPWRERLRAFWSPQAGTQATDRLAVRAQAGSALARQASAVAPAVAPAIVSGPAARPVPASPPAARPAWASTPAITPASASPPAIVPASAPMPAIAFASASTRPLDNRSRSWTTVQDPHATHGPAWIGGPMNQRLRGREGEERQIIRMLHTVAADTSAVLHVEGGWGSGRTRLLREAAETARGLGFDVVDGDWLPGAEPAELAASSARQPVLVVLDDLQHADPAFARSLRTLPWRLRDRPIAWLLSRRRGAGGPVTDQLFACTHPSGGRIELRPLSPQAVRLLLADCTYGAVTGMPSLLRAVGGNPLLTVELARSLHGEGPNGDLTHPPVRVQASVRRCMLQLSADCRRLLRVGAILGPRFTLTDVAVMLRVPAAELLAPLDEALAADILAGDGDRLVFAQELFWRCVVLSLPRPARTALRHDAATAQINLAEPEPAASSVVTFDYDHGRDPIDVQAGWAALNDIERKVARLVSQGLTNQQIAGHVFRSPHTINYHLRQIFRKLDIHSRVELARLTLLHYTATAEESDEAGDDEDPALS